MDHLVFFWLNAELTFIVLACLLDPSPNDLKLTNEDIRALPMIGDVNLFKNSREDPKFEVEGEVMIAGPFLHLSSLPSPLNEQENPSSPPGTSHSAPFSLQSPCTAVNSVRMQHLFCSCPTPTNGRTSDGPPVHVPQDGQRAPTHVEG